MDDNKPQRVLDVVHPKLRSKPAVGPFPSFSITLSLRKPPTTACIKQSSSSSTGNANPISAPADVQFSWSDGHLEVTKHFHFDHSYVVRVDVTAKLDGKPIQAGLAWLGGFGDLTVTNPAPVETVTTYYSENGKITNFPYKKLEGVDQWGPGVWQGGKDFAGIEDRYFTAAFLPAKRRRSRHSANPLLERFSSRSNQRPARLPSRFQRSPPQAARKLSHCAFTSAPKITTN